MPLSGIRVLDLGRFIAAPWSAQMLGDLGAEVIKIERPGSGDEIRSYGPPFVDTRDGRNDMSFDYVAVNRNKKSLTVNLAHPEGQKLILELAKSCDVLIENFKTGDLARRGLSYADVAKVNPDVIYCSITGFGQTGPYASRPGLDSVFQAMSGLMSVTGEADGPATKTGTMVCDMVAGTYAVVAIMAALRHRDVNGGGGQHIDLALLDAAIASMTTRAQSYLTSGVVPTRTGAATPGNHPSGTFPCADGELLITAGADAQFRRLMNGLGLAEVADEPRFATRPLRVENKTALTAIIEGRLREKTRAEWLEILVANDVMAAPINTVKEAFDDPQVQHRGVAAPTTHARAGDMKLVANPIRFSKTPVKPFLAPPDIGEHTDELLTQLLGATPADIERLREEGVI